MSCVLAVAGLSLETCRTVVAYCLAEEGGPVLSVEVRLLGLDRDSEVGIHEWRPQRDEDLDIIIEEVARCIAKHTGTGATILVRRGDRTRNAPAM